MKLIDTYYEGQVIRTLRNLDELLRALVNATKIIGNLELENLFNSAIEKTKRGIPFAPSLYIQ